MWGRYEAGTPGKPADADCFFRAEYNSAFPGVFAAANPDYTVEGWHGTMQKTWRKLSLPAHSPALGLPLRADFKAIAVAAIAAL